MQLHRSVALSRRDASTERTVPLWASLASSGGVHSVPVNGDFSPMHAWPADPIGV